MSAEEPSRSYNTFCSSFFFGTLDDVFLLSFFEVTSLGLPPPRVFHDPFY